MRGELDQSSPRQFQTARRHVTDGDEIGDQHDVGCQIVRTFEVDHRQIGESRERARLRIDADEHVADTQLSHEVGCERG
ncbi:MAG: hypothetical protein JRE71_15675 [Deltaproteobacteria bacterium]|nr:hypothetical protein [Deltaproteobacteria bacterium]